MKARHLGTLAIYVAVNFAVAAIWHLVLFADTLAATTPFARPQPIFPLGVAAMLVQGSLLIALYPRFHRPRRRVASGVHLGITAGLFLATGSIWVEVAKFAFRAPVSYLLLETTYTLLSFALLGAVVGIRHQETHA